MTIADHHPTPDANDEDRAKRALAGAPPLLPVMVATGEGAWVTDVEGRRYLDLTADPALTFGHRHPALLAVATEQLGRLTSTGTVVADDRADGFADALAALLGAEAVLPATTGRDALRAAVDATLAAGERTAVVVAAGSHPDLTAAGAVVVPFGEIDALVAALDDTVAAVVLEPVQAAAGVVGAPAGYLEAARQATADRGIALILDETRSGLGRLGDTVALAGTGAAPDLRVIGPALGGGIVPVAAVVGSRTLLGEAADPASASPLASAIAHRVVEMLEAGEVQNRARALAEHLAGRIEALVGAGAVAVRTAGVWAGVDVDPTVVTAAEVARRLVARGVLVDVVGDATIVLVPPLVIRATELDWAIEQLRVVLAA
ncbi:aminotransferase class III-fold pyridoxal phosphate-dependent enzyme [Microbacterium sp. NE2HP2]|uniref:aminotransferase class III-fold pyridoxal phosphate-dependent enzyme n=1 Tax=Microbacterium TaxID=33882 RepID=UPI0023651119|nr:MULTISPECIES: aminotransferase class III-fold pyridoxal phosphate-dependent enzyme [Microbacterium]MDD7944297.1 aminotransferase class III-fold pyridoxal phosphate-dependent enzyme [Microbacterium plantarum]WHE36629.1 aminotransferase class III-fold pyridoxal phosphate-dependent enzyme [Microbacterium sp. BDGP8]